MKLSEAIMALEILSPKFRTTEESTAFIQGVNVAKKEVVNFLYQIIEDGGEKNEDMASD